MVYCMKYVTYWYQFFTSCEELVPILQGVKFSKCEICGSTELTNLFNVSSLCNHGFFKHKVIHTEMRCKQFS